MIELHNVSVSYPGHPVLSSVSLSLTPGKVLVLAGPNGCGKSTLLRTIAGLHPTASGEILWNGTSIRELSSRKLAKQVSYLPQSRHVPNVTARRMVLFGRFPYLSWPRRYSNADLQLADQALQWADAADLSDRLMPSLSGGQQQKVFLAMALAQDTETVLLDEPTAWLDVRHQLELMKLAHRLAGQGKAVVLVLHDLGLALRTADEIAVFADSALLGTTIPPEAETLSGTGAPPGAGTLLGKGTPDEIFSSGLLDRVFSVSFCRVRTETGWHYYCESPTTTEGASL